MRGGEGGGQFVGVMATRWAGHFLPREGQSGRTEAAVGCGFSAMLDDANESFGDYEYSSGALLSELWKFLQAC